MLLDRSRAEFARAAAVEQDRRARVAEQKEAAEEDLLAFIRMMWKAVEPVQELTEGWVLEAMCDFLMAVTDGHITRGIINVPPGSGKSLILNVFYPAWLWGPCNRPHLRFICASYNEGLPERDNSRFMRLVKDPVYQQCWGDRVRLTREPVGCVENDRTGWKRTTSTHSGTTGHRGDFVLIDDPNDPNNVESDAVREATTHWLKVVMPDRLNNLDTGVIINLQQRVKEDDATGVLAEMWPDCAWLMVSMEFDPLRIFPVTLRPAMAYLQDDGSEVIEPEDVWVDPRSLDADGNQLAGLGTDRNGRPMVEFGSPMAQAEGILAWPERFSAEAVEEQRRSKGWSYSGQYLQLPTARSGEVIKRDWWKPWTKERFPDQGTVLVSVDTAYEEGERNDYNAVTAWGAFPDDIGAPQLILVAAWRARMPLAELVAKLGKTCFDVHADYLLIEHKSRGRDVHDEIQRQFVNATWQTQLVKPVGDKMQRLEAVSPLFSGDMKRMPMPGSPGTFIDTYSGGMIWAPDTGWADDVITEVANFPRAAHDDYVDSTSQALLWVRKHGLVVRRQEFEIEEESKKKFKRTPKVPYAL